MVPPCASTIDRTIVRPIPRPCGFVVKEWREQRLEDLRRHARPRVAHGDVDVGGPDVAADRDETPCRRRLAIASMAFITRFTNTCWRST